MNEIVEPGNRVFQLEAHNLDIAFNRSLDQLVESLDIPRISDEIKLLLKFYIFSGHFKKNSTIGMNIYNLRFYDAEEDVSLLSKAPKSYKLLLLATINLIVPYINEKYNNKRHSLFSANLINDLKINWLRFDNVKLLFKSIALLNFLIFLRNGRYLLLQNRILRIVTGVAQEDYNNNVSINRVQMELINRELIWKAMVDFFTTVIPFINLDRVKSQSLRILGLGPKFKRRGQSPIKEQLGKCGICGKQPFNPFTIGCRHVFCYYCLYAKYLSDKTSGYSCLLCRYKTDDHSQIQRYRTLTLQ